MSDEAAFPHGDTERKLNQILQSLAQQSAKLVSVGTALATVGGKLDTQDQRLQLLGNVCASILNRVEALHGEEITAIKAELDAVSSKIDRIDAGVKLLVARLPPIVGIEAKPGEPEKR